MVDIVDAPNATDVYVVQQPQSAEVDERADWLATCRTPEIALLLIDALTQALELNEGARLELREP